MDKTATVLVSFVVAASFAVVLAQTSQESLRIDLRDARKYVGKIVTVCGKVATHHCPRPRRTTYLDLETPYWSEGVSVTIPSASRPAFGSRVEDRYAFRTVCATGRVEREDKRYLVTVSQPAELRIEREPEPPPVVLEPAGVRGCDENVELPQPITRVKPEYPLNAQAKRREGIVLLDGVVRTDGSVGDVVVVHSLDSESGLDAEATRAFKLWRFTPGTLGSHPIPVIVGVQIRFERQ